MTNLNSPQLLFDLFRHRFHFRVGGSGTRLDDGIERLLQQLDHLLVFFVVLVEPLHIDLRLAEDGERASRGTGAARLFVFEIAPCGGDAENQAGGEWLDDSWLP